MKHSVKYQSTQTGWLINSIMMSTILFLTLAYLFQWGDNPLPLVAYIALVSIFIFIVLLLYKMKIQVLEDYIMVVYGVGIIKFKLKIDQLEEVHIIKIPIGYGIGIRITPKGMLYNIHGRTVVQVKFHSGSVSETVMLGTDNPEALKEVIEKQFKTEI